MERLVFDKKTGDWYDVPDNMSDNSSVVSNGAVKNPTPAVNPEAAPDEYDGRSFSNGAVKNPTPAVNPEAAPDEYDGRSFSNTQDATQTQQGTKVTTSENIVAPNPQTDVTEMLKNQEFADLYAKDKNEAIKLWNIYNAEGLPQAIDSVKWAEETPEQQQERLRKERRNRRLTGAASLVGALGNLATASFARDGRSVVMPDGSAAVEKAQSAAQKEREAALAQLNQYRKRKSDILEGGYKNAEVRERQRKEDERAEAQLKATIELNAANAETKAREAAAKIAKMEHDMGIADQKQAANDELVKAQIAKAKAETYKIYKEGAGKTDKDNIGFIISNGDDERHVINIKKGDYTSAMNQAWGKLLPSEKVIANAYLDELLRLSKEDEGKDDGGFLKDKNDKTSKKWAEIKDIHKHTVLQMLAARGLGVEAINELRLYAGEDPVDVPEPKKARITVPEAPQTTGKKTIQGFGTTNTKTKINGFGGN